MLQHAEERILRRKLFRARKNFCAIDFAAMIFYARTKRETTKKSYDVAARFSVSIIRSAFPASV
jgi:hypothetical protein